ncbi:MAG: hypothetical protein WC977_13295 [Anaerovoracaceae bacterium]|jgi:hypothetical protein
MTRVPKCAICKTEEACYAMQYIGEDRPSFYRLGWHIRGFSVTKVCEKCADKIKEESCTEPS